MQRQFLLITIGCLSLLGIVPVASAQEGTARHLTIRPSLQTRAVASDNIGVVRRDRDADIGIWLSPRLEIDFREDAYRLGLDASLDVRRYTERNGFDETFYRVHGFGEVGVIPGLTVRVSNALTPQPVRLGVPDDEPANLVQTNRAVVETRYWRELPGRREVTFGLSGARFDTGRFDAVVAAPGGGTQLDTGFRADFWEGQGFFEFHNPIGTRNGVYLRGVVRHRDFDQSGGADHLEASGLLGFRSFIEPGLSLDVAGGWGWLDLDRLGSESRSLARASIALRRPNGWHFQLGAHNEFTIDVAGNDFVDTTGRLRIEKFFSPQTAAAVTGFASYLISDSVAPTSNVFGGAEVSLRRQLSRELGVMLAYRYWQNAGAFSGDDLRQNRAMLTLTYRR